MPRVTLNLVGETYGRLLVLEEGDPYIYKGKIKDRTYRCQCDCGTEVIVNQSNLRKGTSTSCGCLKGEKHNGTNHPEYKIWQAIKNRCYNSNQKSYKDYGAKGVTVCDRWLHSYSNFIQDMGPRPTSTSTIERVDVNGNYEPSNCIWLERKYQSRNQTTTVLNEELVIYIRQQRDSGVKLHDVITELNISRDAISSVWNDRTWKDVI